jgi:hypothetical protein
LHLVGLPGVVALERGVEAEPILRPSDDVRVASPSVDGAERDAGVEPLGEQ